MNLLRPRSAWMLSIYTMSCLFFFSCSTTPEVFLLRTYLGIPGTENVIESGSAKQGVREISVQTEEIPKSIIFIIADGLGIGQFTLMYYDISDFAPADFTHTGLMTVHPSGHRKVPDSANTASSMATGVKTH